MCFWVYLYSCCISLYDFIFILCSCFLCLCSVWFLCVSFYIIIKWLYGHFVFLWVVLCHFMYLWPLCVSLVNISVSLILFCVPLSSFCLSLPVFCVSLVSCFFLESIGLLCLRSRLYNRTQITKQLCPADVDVVVISWGFLWKHSNIHE